MRAWWQQRTDEQRRASIAARNQELVREQDRLKQAKRRKYGTDEQKLKICNTDMRDIHRAHDAQTRLLAERDALVLRAKYEAIMKWSS